MNSIAIIISHPIQYYVPFFKLLAKHCDLKVFYTWGEESGNIKYDPGFKKTIAWDLPLLEAYTYEFLVNTAKDPGSHHFNGIINPSLVKAIETFKPDVVLVYGWAYKSHWVSLRYFKGKIPIWFRGDSTLIDEQNGIKQVLRSLFLKWVYRNVDKALYVGNENKKYFKKFGIKESDLIFVPHAIDNVRFAENRSDEAKQIRSLFNIKDDDVLILFAGKLEHKKNPELLLRAFIELHLSIVDRLSAKDKQTNLHLLFVGNGELEESLKSKIQSLELREELKLSFDSRKSRDKFAQDDITGECLKMKIRDTSTSEEVGTGSFSKTNIHFMDFQNQTQMPAVYQACDLFCLPSQGPGETWGLAVNEAMAAGKPVLVSDKVGCSSDLVTSETGLIFKSNDIDDLKQKLIALTRDKKQLDEMGKSAQQHIQNWSFEEQINAILNYANR